MFIPGSTPWHRRSDAAPSIMSFKEIPVQLPALRALYKNLGEEKIRKILIRFYQIMSEDILVGFFFAGKDLNHIAHRQGDFLLRAMGATPSYNGLPPSEAHQALPPILSGHFDRRLKILEETLQEFNLTPEEITVWIGFENAFRESILEVNPKSPKS